MKDRGILGFIAAAALFCVAGSSDAEEQIPQPSYRDSGHPGSSVAGELELLKQRIEELETAKRAHEDAASKLNQRLRELETAKMAHERATGILKQRLEDLETAKIARGHETPEEATRRIEQRVEELAKTKIAHEDATRTIIRQSFAERASSINDYVDFSGTLEALAFRSEDLRSGALDSNVLFDTADLDFKILVSDWVSGSLVLSYEAGSEFLAQTSQGDPALVDRLTVREAFITLGNTQSFPFFGRAGRAVVPFGTSTGDPVTSSLTLTNPLTIEVFETREDFFMFGFDGPTPPPPPPLATTPVAVAPPVRPLLIDPLVRKLSTWLCASLSCYPPPPKPVPPALLPTPLPPLTAAVYFYKGDTFEGSGNHIEHVGATLGYQTKGYFPGRRIPWAIDFDVDFNSSIFDSDFLAFEYRPFLNEIGNVPGMAAHLKSNLGPIALIVEWNGAIDNATFTDEALVLVEPDPGDPDEPAVPTVIPGDVFSIRPSTWQVELAYQFDFNPSAEAIGAQGTYFVVGYSESEDLVGVTRVIDNNEDKVGFVPERRLNVGVGEWVVPGVRVAFEYSHDWDYSIANGGSGNSADGFFGQLTYEW